jgi:dihydrofolate reductase
MCRGHESSPPSLQVVLVLVEPSVALIPEATIVPTWTPRPRRTFNQEEDHVGRIVVTEFVSLDGVMEDPGGAENFRHGGWSFEISRGDEGNKFKLDETVSSEALLLGRVTYEGFAAAWPSREGEFADKFNAMPKYVVSSTLEEPEWNNSTVLEGDVAQEVAKLKQELGGNIVVHGSAQLVQTLVEHDLVDELRLMVFPVVLGAGKRLFGETSDKKPLRLVGSQVVGDGVTILTYEPARASAEASTAS